MRRLAAIDIGTNTIRMLVAESGGRQPVPIARRRSIVGLGRSLRETGRIGEAEFAAGLRILREFHREIRDREVAAYRACGTACLREAENRADFLEAAAGEGIDVEVIGPAEEARLTWEGIRWAVAGRPGDVAMDIGGGSTEFAFGPREGESVSLSTGVVVLSTLLPLSDPPVPCELRAVSYYAAGRIEDGTRPFGRRRFRRLIGTAGTFTTLAAMERGMTRYDPDRINGTRLSEAVVRRWADRLGRMTDAQRLRLPGMEKGRERYVVPGVLLIVAAMERFRLNGVTVSDTGLLEGILAGVRRNGGEDG
jgi:exopolyphosphatase / guanosine-5'-triphosphate,3'-diphosphate pyrophosphatase